MIDVLIGYDIILIETVGVGQSEIICSSMVDIFLMLQLPNAGDELQGVKKGILELADLICVNKSDGDYITAAKHTKAQLESALHLVKHQEAPEILTISSLHKHGIKETIERIFALAEAQKKSGLYKEKRINQSEHWFKEELDHQIMEHLNSKKSTVNMLEKLTQKVRNGQITGSVAAKEIAHQLFKNL